MRVMVLGNGQRAGVSEEAERLLPFLRQHCEVALVGGLRRVPLIPARQ